MWPRYLQGAKNIRVLRPASRPAKRSKMSFSSEFQLKNERDVCCSVDLKLLGRNQLSGCSKDVIILSLTLR